MAFQYLSHLLPNQMQQATAASVGNFYPSILGFYFLTFPFKGSYDYKNEWDNFQSELMRLK